MQGVTVTYLATNLAYLSQPRFASCADIAGNIPYSINMIIIIIAFNVDLVLDQRA